jgi:undecaprenyl-diphosphatase
MAPRALSTRRREHASVNGFGGAAGASGTRDAHPIEGPLLPDTLRRPVAVVSMLAAVAVVAVAFIVANDTGPGSFDRAVRPPGGVSATESRWALAIDSAGEPMGLMALVALLVGASLVLRRRRVAVLVVLGTGLTISATTALKPLVGRTIHDIYLSYPSGHTASATALGMAAAWLAVHRLGRVTALALLYGAAAVVGAAAAWAQSVLVAHYPSDTVGGWCTALAVLPTTAWLMDLAALRWSGRQRSGPLPDP